MHRIVRIAAIAAGAVLLLLLLLLLGTAGIIALTVDPNDYKDDISARVHEKFGRRLTIPGDIALSYWPRPGVRLGKAHLSEYAPDGGEFAAIDSARLSFAVLPLLRGELVIDRVDLRGARVRLVRRPDGSMNIDDLTASRAERSRQLPTPAPGAQGHRIGSRVDSIRIDNARVTFDDRRNGRRIEITHLNVDSGPIAHNVPSRIALSANLGISRPAVNTAIILTTGFGLDRDARRVALSGLELYLDMALKDAGAHAKAKLNGSIDIDLAKDDTNVVLKGRLDDSAIDAKLGLRAGLLQVALGIDKIDLGRYSAAAAAPASTPASSPGAAQEPVANDAPLDLSALATLRANGNLHIGALTVGGVRLTQVNAMLKADAGKVALSPVLATLYGGGGKGALTLEYGDDPATPRIHLSQSLSGIELGPLLRDALGKAPVNGRGDLQFNLHTQGASMLQLRQALNGGGSLRLSDGSVSGFNLAQIVREAKAAGGVASDADKTDFSELGGSFSVTDGVVRNDDLLVKTALLRIGGTGEVDLVAAQIDYTLMCTAVPTLSGQGGPDAAALKGITVPVKLSGPLSAIVWRIDVKAMVPDKVKQKLKDKLKSKIGGKLRGLLGR